MVFRQTLKARCVGEPLRYQEADRDAKFILLGRRPAVDILENTGQGRFFKRFLKIFVPEAGGLVRD
jgi:hypothetical protein